MKCWMILSNMGSTIFASITGRNVSRCCLKFRKLVHATLAATMLPEWSSGRTYLCDQISLSMVHTMKKQGCRYILLNSARRNVDIRNTVTYAQKQMIKQVRSTEAQFSIKKHILTTCLCEVRLVLVQAIWPSGCCVATRRHGVH